MTLNPKEYAYQLVEEGYLSHSILLSACLKYMSWRDIEEMLILNCFDELLPDTDIDNDY